MNLKVDGIKVHIAGFSDTDYEKTQKALRDTLADKESANRDAIRNAFTTAVSLAPTANPSDLWHHVVYREYIRIIAKRRQVRVPGQSWVRASGDALEQFFEQYYNRLLKDTEIRLVALLSDAKRIGALKLLGVYGKVGNSKLDIAIVARSRGRGKALLESGKIIGGLHVKASLAERVSDDVPCSVAMMKQGYTSFLITLDVKSFPLSPNVSDARAYLNRGELGSPQIPSDKRRYIEEHGSFDACFSYNSRTIPSKGRTKSGKRIFVCSLGGKWDALCDALVSAAASRK